MSSQQEKRSFCNLILHQAATLIALLIVIAPALFGVGFIGNGGVLSAEENAPVRVYSQLSDPRENPEYERHAVRAPSWDTFHGRTQMTSLRGFAIKDDRIVDYSAAIEKYTKTHPFGDVIWPSYPIIFAKNLGDFADEIKRRNLYLFDLWGYVPGSGEGGYWRQFKPSPDAFKMLEAKLGERWLGMDNGEQDGRYIGGYANQMCPQAAGRFEQYCNFQRHFQKMTDELGNKMASLVSLNYGHYFLKEGVYTLLGAETAQALPNSQIYYAFIRGACKQYGVLWFGNASVYNRWGHKDYNGVGGEKTHDPYGPTKGTSLSLLKRLMYSHILYNSAIVGFESGLFEHEKISPIGRIQLGAVKWLNDNGQPGTMLTPVAVMTDFFAGWTFPRHLYTGNVYRVWGNLPYEAGDYLTDGVLDLLYPRYQDSSYFHDETGFLTPTPYGDAADCLLSDTPGWLLSRYSLLIVTGELSGGAEIRDKLSAYVQGGGHLVITAGNVAKMPGGSLLGFHVKDIITHLASKQMIDMKPSPVVEDSAFDLLALDAPSDAKTLARCGQLPAVVECSCGKGKITVLASRFGVGTQPVVSGKEVANVVDKPLPKPFPLLKHVAAALDAALRSQTLFDAGRDLHVVTCKKSPGVYTVGIFNNAFKPQSLAIVSHCGEIASIRELTIDASERGAVGQLPPGVELASIGENSPATIAGGDVRIFEVRLRQDKTQEIAHIVPPARPHGRILPLRKIVSIKEAILARPTFFEHFDGVMVDWRYLHDRSPECVAKEAGWIGRQKLRVVVDLTSGINLYPDLRLVNNLEDDYAASIAAIDDVLGKMKMLGSHDLVLSSQRLPENNITPKRNAELLDATLRDICRKAESQQTTVYLRIYPNKPPANLDGGLQLLKRIGAANLKLAPSTAMFSAKNVSAEAGKAIGFWMAGASEVDAAGCRWNVQRPLAGDIKREELEKLLATAPNAPIVFDAIYENQDAEYLDAMSLAPQTAKKP